MSRQGSAHADPSPASICYGRLRAVVEQLRGGRSREEFRGLALSLSLSAVAEARGTFDDLTSVTVFKEPLGEGNEPSTEFAPLDAELASRLGSRVVEYEARATGWLSAQEAEEVAELARGLGYFARTGELGPIHGPAYRFDPRSDVREPWRESDQVPIELAGLFWVQFAYPVRADWLEALPECWVSPLGTMPVHSVLVWASDRSAIEGCDVVAPYLALVRPVLSTDRARPEYLEHTGPFHVQLIPGVEPFELGADLPPNVSVTEVDEPGIMRTAAVRGEGAVAALLDDPRVVTIVPTSDQLLPSSEREAQILARNFVGSSTTGQPATTPPYDTFLTNRGLRTASNQQTIAIVDSGIDHPLSSTFHTDLLGKVEPTWGWYKAVSGTPAYNDTEGDDWGHGTLVAGIAAGSGTSPATDGGFRRGMGIAPDASLIAVRQTEGLQSDLCKARNSSGNLNAIYNYVRRYPLGHPLEGQHWSRVANFSQNSPDVFEYDDWARYHDRRVADAKTNNVDVMDPMTVVFSAGNYEPGAPLAVRLVTSPGTAKNVITVGSVDSWYPATLPAVQRYCFGAATPHPVPQGPFQPSDFSRYTATGTAIHETRIKPDLVVPGWRVDGAQPDAPLECPPATPSQSGLSNKLICRQEENKPATASHTYGRGTSFAAPQVSGAAALRIKKFLDGGHDPSPALVKASLIATAQSLGPKNISTGTIDCATPHGCRPSLRYGWGIVDLDRATNTVPRWWFDEGHDFTAAGQGWASPWLRPVSSSSGEDVLIVVVWTDPVTQLSGGPGALVRDLDVTVTRAGTSKSWTGNGFLPTGYSQPIQAGGLPPLPIDVANNVEAIFLRPGQELAGEWPFRISIHVSSFGTPGSGWPTPLAGKQPFAVYVYNAEEGFW